MPEFQAISPRGEIVATQNFECAEEAHTWFMSVADHAERGWRMQVSDEGQWAFFDDTGGFTAPASRHL